MLVLLRIVFTSAFIYCIVEARRGAGQPTAIDDVSHAFWLAVAVIVGLACSATWAPYLGEKVAGPLTGGWTESHLDERKNLLLQLIRWCDKRHNARAVRWLCFFEGVRAPHLPTAFILGLKNSKSGSWLEKVYAREVWRFNHTENCVKAFLILQQHGINPGLHNNSEVNLALFTKERQVASERRPIEVPVAPPVQTLQRDTRIRIGKS